MMHQLTPFLRAVLAAIGIEPAQLVEVSASRFHFQADELPVIASLATQKLRSPTGWPQRGVYGAQHRSPACWTKPLRGRFKTTIDYSTQYTYRKMA